MFECYVPKSISQKMLIRWSQEIIPWHKQVLQYCLRARHPHLVTLLGLGNFRRNLAMRSVIIFRFFSATPWVKKETLTNIVDDRIIFLSGDYGWITAFFKAAQHHFFVGEKPSFPLGGWGFHRQWRSTLRKVGSTWPSSLLGVGASKMVAGSRPPFWRVRNFVSLHETAFGSFSWGNCGNSNIFGSFSPLVLSLGVSWSKFDGLHLFQMGWFNLKRPTATP